MKNTFKFTIGIMGGFGPSATSYAFSRLIDICQKEYNAVQDKDFPNIIVTSLPLETLNEHGFANTSDVKQQLRDQIKTSSSTMKRAGAEIVYLPCNTLHEYQNILHSAGLKEVRIIDSVVNYAVNNLKKSKIGVLSSRTSRREKIYEKSLQEKGFDFIDIEDRAQEKIDKLILKAMGGVDIQESRETLQVICRNLLEKCEYVILGCTELSLLADVCVNENDGVVDAQEISLRRLLRSAEDEV